MNIRHAAAHNAAPMRRMLHLVTVAQRGYSCALLAVYGAKFAGRSLLEGTARPPDALGHTVRKTVPQGL
jgi:hypothetical protein